MMQKRTKIILGILISLLILGTAFLTYEVISGAVKFKADDAFIDVWKVSLNPNKRTAVADGKDSITFSYGQFYAPADDVHYAPNPCIDGASRNNPKPACSFSSETSSCSIPLGYDLYATVSGTNNIINPSIFPTNCETGYSTFTVSSTQAETKIIHVQPPIGKGGGYYDWISTSVTFTAPSTTAPATTTPTSTSTKKTTAKTTTKTSATPAATKPAVPVLSTINNGTLDQLSNQTILTDEDIVLTGTAIPNVTIKLYIYSEEPINDQTTVDASGNWTYTIAKNTLPEGTHRIEAEVVDSAGNTSDRVEIASFDLIQKTEKVVQEPINDKTQNKIKPLYVYIYIGVLAVILGAIIFLFIRNRKKKKEISEESIK